MFRRCRTVGALLAVVLSVSLAACGAQPGTTAPITTTSTSTTTSANATAAPPAAAVIPEQLKFTVQTTDGQGFSGESLAGKKVVL